jgi:hypothetical protein
MLSSMCGFIENIGPAKPRSHKSDDFSDLAAAMEAYSLAWSNASDRDSRA